MKIYLDTVGCRLNQSEIELFARQFRSAGHTLVPSAKEADLVVVNTCTVTSAAAADSRKKIRRFSRQGARKIVVTGCWSSLEPSTAASLPSVHQLVHNRKKDQLVPDVLGTSNEQLNIDTVHRQPVPGPRTRTRAFIKAQDGCNNHCAYCITTIARGPSRSRPASDVLSDILSAQRGGAKEVILSGVHLGSWGGDFDPPLSLQSLVQAILVKSSVPRVRLSSLEPWDIDTTFFDLWKDNRLCRHLHLVLQSGSASVLERMKRKISPEAYASLIIAARSAIPGVSITTDILVGFPGESDDEFNESLCFVRQMQFSDGHVFTFSPRPGTAAEKMPCQVPDAIRKERSETMRAVFSASAKNYREKFLGKSMSVLWESSAPLPAGNWQAKGLTDNYLRVSAQSPVKLWNEINQVKLTGIIDKKLQGQINSEKDYE